jgi:hypothetical protein
MPSGPRSEITDRCVEKIEPGGECSSRAGIAVFTSGTSAGPSASGSANPDQSYDDSRPTVRDAIRIRTPPATVVTSDGGATLGPNVVVSARASGDASAITSPMPAAIKAVFFMGLPLLAHPPPRSRKRVPFAKAMDSGPDAAPPIGVPLTNSATRTRHQILRLS